MQITALLGITYASHNWRKNEELKRLTVAIREGIPSCLHSYLPSLPCLFNLQYHLAVYISYFPSTLPSHLPHKLEPTYFNNILANTLNAILMVSPGVKLPKMSICKYH